MSCVFCQCPLSLGQRGVELVCPALLSAPELASDLFCGLSGQSP